MKRSNGRFLTTHMGGLSRPDDLTAMLTAKDAGQPYDKDALAKRVKGAVAEVVKLQIDNGIDIVNDGELSKFSWAAYFADRLDGLDRKPGQARAPITARESLVFPGWFKVAGAGGFSGVQRLAAFQRGEQPVLNAVGARRAYAVGPLKFIGQKDVQEEIGRAHV